MTKEIPLTKRKFAIVDDDDFEELNKFKWQASQIRPTGNCYATRRVRVDGKSSFIRMHRVINKTPEGLDTDHINGNGLDNRKENLRSVSRSQNAMNANKRMRGKYSSVYKGVRRSKSRWRASICVNGRDVRLGLYALEIEAARAYDEKAKEIYGEFARLNNA